MILEQRSAISTGFKYHLHRLRQPRRSRSTDPEHASGDTIIECRRCNAVRGTVAELHMLAQHSRDLFEFWPGPRPMLSDPKTTAAQATSPMDTVWSILEAANELGDTPHRRGLPPRHRRRPCAAMRRDQLIWSRSPPSSRDRPPACLASRLNKNPIWRHHASKSPSGNIINAWIPSAKICAFRP